MRNERPTAMSHGGAVKLAVVTISLRTVGALAAVLAVLAVFIAVPVRAQPAPFPEGSLVQAPDGSLYVFEGGQYHLIRPVNANPQQMSAAPSGDPVVTGVMIIPPAGQPDPCGMNHEIRLCVVSVQRPFQGSFEAQPGYEFAVIRVRITNLRDSSVLMPGYVTGLRVRDVNGSTRDWPSGGNTPPVPESLEGTTLLPGDAIEGNAIIAVPTGVPLVGVNWLISGNQLQSVDAPIR
jgi:hypothetical protein